MTLDAGLVRKLADAEFGLLNEEDRWRHSVTPQRSRLVSPEASVALRLFASQISFPMARWEQLK